MTRAENKVQIIRRTHPCFGSVRIVILNQETWFIAYDVAKALGYQNPKSAIKQHCKRHKTLMISGDVPEVVDTIVEYKGYASASNTDRKRIKIIDEHGTPYLQTSSPPTIIPQSDVIRLIMRSKLPAAEDYQDWVFEEVLPSIHTKGFYSALTPAQQLHAMTGEIVRAEQERIQMQATQVHHSAQLTEHNSRLDSLEEYREDRQLKRQQAQQDLFDLSKDMPEDDTPVQPKPLRNLLNEVVRQFSITQDTPFNQAWVKVYTEFKHRYHVDIMTRTHNENRRRRRKNPKTKKINYLDIAEQEGVLHDLLKVARIICMPNT